MADDFDEMDMDEFLSCCVRRLCPMCGTPITQKPNGRPRKFCTDACRRKFWKRHPKADKWDSFAQLVCPVCGRMFFVQKENTRTRKYCSRACANRGRLMNGGKHENS